MTELKNDNKEQAVEEKRTPSDRRRGFKTILADSDRRKSPDRRRAGG
jgi:hypothetical protein